MYSEVVPVRFQGGVHNGTLAALTPFGQHGLRLNGLDPADYNNWDSLMTQHRDPNSQVEIGVEHPDPQTARDIATIARHTIWNGRNLWPGREIPPERFNQGANYLRQHEGLPPEPGMQAVGSTIPQWFVSALEMSGVLGGAGFAGSLVPAINLWNEYRAKYGENPNALQTWLTTLKTVWNDRGLNSTPTPYDERVEDLRSVSSKAEDSAGVSGDMSVVSKWQVVALGELQQPGGVGATQDYNPVVDGPNPNGPDFADNANNSPEQEIALQTWVNLAVDSLNRGETPEAILAQLAHDGCPNPQEVLQRAQQQPEQAPVSDQIGQDPFDAPATQDPSQSGQMESLSQQPPVQAKVRVAGTTMTGVEVDRWEDMWGQGTVRIALDGGGTINVAPDAVEAIEGDAYKHPVSEIQSFIDSMPEVAPSRPHIEARLANLELVRRAVRSNISKVGFSDQVKLQQMDSAAEAESALLKEILSNHAETFEVAYAKAQPRFQFNAFKTATPEITPWGGRAREAGAIWAVENFDTAVDDDMSFKAAAAHFASNLGLTGEQFTEFLAGAEEHRKVRTDEFTAEEPVENEGPAEALFV